uniref:Prokaryotic-type class I peptide chain release factors domain-containing protein n=1 Tax=Scleropages formosus TaxID=113540 RepID=A0A8C9UYI6_SCLFO
NYLPCGGAVNVVRVHVCVCLYVSRVSVWCPLSFPSHPTPPPPCVSLDRSPERHLQSEQRSGRSAREQRCPQRHRRCRAAQSYTQNHSSDQSAHSSPVTTVFLLSRLTVNTKVEVRFHVQTADWIPEEVRNKILSQNENRINKAGELMVTSEASRSQQRNLSDCLQKISDIIAEASRRPREPTAEDLALRKSRLEYWNKERLKQKKIHSALKQSRKVDFD